MAQTKIEWTDYTFNGLWGCEKISPGCKHCYAEAWDKRLGGKHWGPGSPRRHFGEDYWAQPLAWNRKAQRDGRIYRVFCSSMADWLEDHLDWIESRQRLEALVAATPNLIWLFLTKRPENWRLIPNEWRKRWPANAMFGFTGENQEWFNKREPWWSELEERSIGLRSFVSIEPMLGHIKVNLMQFAGIDWVICGGESGANARPMHPDWARSLRDQCAAAGVPFLFKQWGEWAPVSTPRMKMTVEGKGRTVLMGPDGTMRQATWADVISSSGDQWAFDPIGKHKAGRLLDGVEHNGLPTYWPPNVGLLAKDELSVLA